jgi:chemotaxis protein MotB
MIPIQRTVLPATDKATPPDWAVTFADMMCLLLTFFVLIASYSYTDASKYRALAGSLRQAFGVREPNAGSSTPGPRVAEGAQGSGAQVLGAEGSGGHGSGARNSVVSLRENLEQKLAALAESGAFPGLQVVRSQEGMRLRVQEGVMFDLGRADVRPEARPLVERLAPIFSRYPGQIWVEGHTDDLPIRNMIYPSNWELSAARAGNVVRALIEAGVPSAHLAAVGYAETRPLAPNLDVESRQRNRRVEFLLTRTLPAAP